MNTPTQEPKVKENINELSLLLDISRILDNSVDLREVMTPVLSSMSKHLGMSRGMITLIDSGSGEIVIDEAIGLTSKQFERGKYKFGEGIIGHRIWESFTKRKEKWGFAQILTVEKLGDARWRKALERFAILVLEPVDNKR